MTSYLFTSESVSEGHPDKVADKISDAIVDAILAQDPRARIAAETLVTTGLCLLAGEITTTAQVNYAQIARNTIREIGYNSPDLGFDGNSISVQVAYGQQSPDIALGVNEGTGLDLEQGAGDQGLMFGYACDETPSYMPAPIYYAHRIMEQQALVRKTGKLSFLRPDAKSQVTFRYVDGEPVDIDTVVVSTQHSPEVDYNTLRDAVITEVILPVLPEKFITPATKFLINPTGRFVIGGPMGDSGLTGRKIIVDTYGGSAPHGGGAFSGKDPSKVDRSAAYALRYVAKNIVAGGFAKKCQIQISYAIGVARPVSIMIDTFGTGVVSDEKLAQAVNTCFDLRPKGIIQMLDLLKPIYSPTASYGHFGREDQDFIWERTDKIEELRQTIEAQKNQRNVHN